VKAKRLIPPSLIVLLAVGGLLLFFNTPSTSPPTLVFKGYEISATNTNTIAKLELRNTTGRTIWLYYSGSRPPFGPQFLERADSESSKPTNGIETSLRFGNSFIEGKKVLQGDSVQLEFPLHSGESAKRVGTIYYLGRFSDSGDFVSHFWKPYLDSNANWKVKAAFYWQRLSGKFKAPEGHEIWCNDLLSFQDAITNSPPTPGPRW
jgi:hypothetical protein